MRACVIGIAILVCGGCATPRLAGGIDGALQSGPDQFLAKAVVGPQNDGTYVVPTTQRIEPAGDQIEFPGRPVGLAFNPDATILAVKNRGDVIFIDVATKTLKQTLKLPKDGNSFCGIAWSRDGKTLWNSATEQYLRGAVRKDDGTFAWDIKIVLPGPMKNSSPGGIALDDDKGLAYVTLSRNNSLAVVNLAEKKLEMEIPVGIAPYTVVIADDKAYVSNWGGRKPKEGEKTGPTSGSNILVDPVTGVANSGTISVIDLKARKVVAEIEVQLHPSEMTFSPDKRTLYVTNANSDTVSVINIARNTVTDTIGMRPMPELPLGSAPNALAASPDGKTLYVCNSGNNAVAVVDIPSKRITGFIPTGWYPGTVLLRDNVLYVGNTKGLGSRYEKANAAEKQAQMGTASGLNSHDHLGTLSIIPLPTQQELESFTTRVAANMRLPKMHETLHLAAGEKKVVPVPTRPGEVSPFTHVLYIIKENRTYDQVLGDMPQGNGDPRLLMFGREVTPNQHAIAEQFVLLDNFYCNGVLSADGHQWTDEGYVTDYLEKSFGDFSRSYPYDGDDAMAYSSAGFIWDYVLKAGLTFRNYGEFVKAKIEPPSATWADIHADFKNGTRNVKISAVPGIHTIEPYLCKDFIGFPGKMQDVYRAQIFLNELKEFEKNDNLPNFMIMLLPNDHTSGTREGMPTPKAQVADNDLAVGQIVEAISHSKYWPETAIFIVEDDPQAGLDHVDGHRTTAYCVSAYTKRKFVDSTHYNQSSMLRTIQLVLGLPPMTQFDLAANPMENCFTEEPDLTPFTAVPNNIPLDQMNPKLSSLTGKQKYYAKKSQQLPLDDIDMADEHEFNRILWHSVHGDRPYPKLAQRSQVGARQWPGAVERTGDDD